MKLFYSKGSCALAAHIVMAELNMAYEVEAVDIRAKTYSGGDFRTINPKGAVPALKLDSGDILTEGAVILQYLADQKPEAGLIPKAGSFERYRAQEWLNHIASDVHKSYSPLFFADRLIKNPEGLSEFKKSAAEMVKAKLGFVSEALTKNEYLMGKNFSVADAYLFTVLSWSGMVGVDLSSMPSLVAFSERVKARPAVMKALKEQGLL